MSFIWPLMLLSLLLIPLFAAGYVWLLKRRGQRSATLGMLGLLQTQTGQTLGRRKHIPFALFLSALALLLMGLARPELTVDLPRIEGTVILAFDVSGSMIADDLAPTRMEAAQAAARAFVEAQPETVRIGVVAFNNGGVMTQEPTDISADVLAAIDRLKPEGSTSLGQGIFAALNALTDTPIAIPEELSEEDLEEIDIGFFGSSVIVLLTDGENTVNPDPLLISELAANAGVRVFPIGIGSVEGTVVELEGFNVATVLDEGLLQEIAAATNGTYFHADNETDLQEIYDTIDLQLTIRGDKMEVTSLLAGIGVLLLLVGGGLSMLWFGRIP